MTIGSTQHKPVRLDVLRLGQLSQVQQQIKAQSQPQAPVDTYVPVSPPVQVPPVIVSAPTPAATGTWNRLHQLLGRLHKPATKPAQPKPAKPAPAKPHPAAPTRHASRDRSLYRAQPNGWSCAVYSTLMAVSAWGVRPDNDNTVNEIIRRTGDRPGVGLPGDASLVVNAVRDMGLQATYHPSGTASAIREVLKQGHTAVVNGSLGIGGHFIYVAGLNKDGTFDIWDPARPSVTRMTDAQLNSFIHTGSHPTAFAEVWR